MSGELDSLPGNRDAVVVETGDLFTTYQSAIVYGKDMENGPLIDFRSAALTNAMWEKFMEFADAHRGEHIYFRMPEVETISYDPPDMATTIGPHTAITARAYYGVIYPKKNHAVKE